MPIPSPGTYDQASQATLLAVKAKTDLIPAAPAQQGTVQTQGYASALAPVHVNASNPAATNTTVTIRPPAGETWRIILVAMQTSVGATVASVETNIRDVGGLVYGGNYDCRANTCHSSVLIDTIIDNTYYMELNIYNGAASAQRYGYTYFGWKV